MTELEQQLLDALQRLERHYEERDEAMMQRLQTLTAQVDALSGQVERLAQALRPLRTMARIRSKSSHISTNLLTMNDLDLAT